MTRIVTVTLNPSVDRSAVVKHITPDDKLSCKDARMDPGGGGLNVCRALHNLGEKAEAFHASGGPVGQMLSMLLDQEQILHRPIPIQGWTRENFVILEEVSGKEYRFNLPGPALETREWESVLHTLADMAPPSFLVASGSLPTGVPVDFYGRLGKVAADHGTKYIVDTSGDALTEALKNPVYLIKPNLRELRNLTGAALELEAEQEEAAASLIESGRCEVVVVSLGSAGALLVTRDLRQRFRTPTVPLKSSVGAGDSMVAGIVFQLQRGGSLTEAVAYGVACGAATVATPGTGLCTKEWVDRLYAKV